MILRNLLLVAGTSLVLAAPASAAGPCAPYKRLHFPCRAVGLAETVRAFQKANRLQVDGVPGPQTNAALKHPATLVPADLTPGTHVEVDIPRQLMSFVTDGQVTAVYDVSTGAPGFDTPLEPFRVGRKELRSWSVPYSTWMPYASYFTGGVAFHAGDPAVRSHGCVHVPPVFAASVYRRLPPGMTVVVV